MISIRTAAASEAPALSALALASKASWGYPAEFLAACEAELTISPQECAAEEVRVAEVDGAPAGFHQTSGEPPEGELVHLFVAPAFLGHGVGRLLLDDARRRAGERGFARLRLDADPHAVGFYEHLGARIVEMVPSGSIPGRMLPQMVLDVG